LKAHWRAQADDEENMDLKLVVVFLLVGAAIWLSRMTQKRARRKADQLPASQRDTLSNES